MHRIHGYILMLGMAVWIASCATSQKPAGTPQVLPVPAVQATPAPALVPTVAPGALGMQENAVPEPTPKPLAQKPKNQPRRHAVPTAQATAQPENLVAAQSAESLEKKFNAAEPQPAGTAVMATWTPTPIAMAAGVLQTSRKQSSAGSPMRMLLGLLIVVLLGSLVVWARRSRDTRDRGVIRMRPPASGPMPKEQVIEKPAPAKSSLAEPAVAEQPSAPAPLVKHISHEHEAPRSVHHAAAEHVAPVLAKKTVKKSVKTRTTATAKKSTAKKSNVISLRAQKQKTASATTRKKAARSQAEIVPFRKKANG